MAEIKKLLKKFCNKLSLEKLIELLRTARAKMVLALCAFIVFVTPILTILPSISYLQSPFDWAVSYISWKLIDSEHKNEILILVAPFQYIGNAPNNLDHQEIKNLLSSEVVKNKRVGDAEIRIEYLSAPVLDGEELKAISLGKQKDATVIIWGSIAQNRTKITVYNSILQKVYGFPEVTEESLFRKIDLNQNLLIPQTQSLSLPETQKVINFAVFNALGAIYYLNQNIEAAYIAYSKSIRVILPRILRGLEGSENLSSKEAELFYFDLKVLSSIEDLRLDGSHEIDLNELLTEIISRSEDSLALSYEKLRLEYYDNSTKEEKIDIVKRFMLLEPRVKALKPGQFLLKQIYPMQLSLMLKDIGNDSLSNKYFEEAIKSAESIHSETIRNQLLATMYFQNNEPEKCIKQLTSPLKTKWSILKLDQIGLKYECQVKAGNLENALNTANELYKDSKNPKLQGKALHIKANVLNMLNRSDEAAIVRKQHIKMNPNAYWDIHNLARYYFIKGNFEESNRLERSIPIQARFTAGIKILAYSDLVLNKSNDEILDDLQFDYLNNNLTKTPESQGLLKAFASALSVRTKSKIYWSPSYDTALTPDEMKTINELSWVIFNDVKDTQFAINYLNFICSKIPSLKDECKFVTGYFASWEAYHAYKIGNFPEAIRWLKLAEKYGSVNGEVYDVLQKNSVLKNVDISKNSISDYNSWKLILSDERPVKSSEVNSN